MDEGRYCLTGDCEGKLPGTRTAHRTLHDTMGWYRAWHHRPLRTAIHTFLALVAITIIGALIVSYAPNRLNPQAAAGILKQFPFQGRLTNNDGTVVANGSYDVVFKLYTVSSGGSAAWTENHTGGSQVTTVDGIFNVMLGSLTSLASIDFNQDTYYIGVTVGADAEMTPRIRLGAAPYAFNADQLDGTDESAFVLLAGRSGGQTLYGGTASGNDLTLRTTSNATKGEVIVADDGGKLRVGTASTLNGKISVGFTNSSSSFNTTLAALYEYNGGLSGVEQNAGQFTIVANNSGSINAVGVTGQAWSQGSANATLIGVKAKILTSSTSISSGTGVSISGPQVGAGTITSLEGLGVLNQGNAVVTTSYGIHVQAQSGSGTNWAIASEGGNSYHVGNLMVGTASAAARTLEVRSTSAQQRWSYDGSNYAEITVGSGGVASLTSSANSLNIGGTTVFNVNTSTGNVGIGAAPATNDRLTVSYSPSSPAGNPTAITSTLAPTYAADTSQTIFGLVSNLNLTSAFNYTSSLSQAIRGLSHYTASSGTVTALSGIHGIGQHNGAGTITSLYGVSAVVNHLSTGGGGGSSVASAFVALTPSLSGSGTYTNGMGLRISDQSVARYTTSHGIRIDDQGTGAGTTWAFGSLGTDDESYFAGELMVGSTTAPTTKLDVKATGVTSGTHDQLKLTSQRAAIVSNNLLGGIQFASDDTNLTAGTHTTTAYIRTEASQTHTASALGTRMLFGVTADSTTTPFEAMRIEPTGNVGIGITPTTLQRLAVDLDGAANSGYVAGAFTLDTTGMTSATQQALTGTVTVTGSTAADGTAIGVRGVSIINKTSGSSAGIIQGMYAAATQSGSVDVANIRGIGAQITTSSTGQVTTRAAAMVAMVPSLSGGTVVENDGLIVADQGDATVTTSYGIRILSQSGSGTVWGIGVDGVSVNNYVYGNLSVGKNSASTARLDVYQQTLGDELIRLESTATNNDPVMAVRQYRGTTTDATLTTIGTIALSASKTYAIKHEVVARRTGGSAGTAEDGAHYVAYTTWKTVGGVTTSIGATAAHVAESQAGWLAGISSDGGGNVLLRVQGAANNNVTWHATVWISEVGS